MVQLFYKKLESDVKDPVFSTKDSACFDIHCFFGKDNNLVKVYNSLNYESTAYIHLKQNSVKEIHILPRQRVLVPTGLVFDIPVGYSVRLHARSGLSIKNGITLVNGEGVVDSDYVQQVYIPIINLSDEIFVLREFDRICQGELVKSLEYTMNATDNIPERKTDRNGGFGSTGT